MSLSSPVVMAEEEQWTEEAAAAPQDLATAEVDSPEIKLFCKWPLEDIQISDISLSVSCSGGMEYSFC